MGSADWMKRNLSNRVEAIVPVEDPRFRSRSGMLDVAINDQRQAGEMMPDGRYRQRRPDLMTTPVQGAGNTHARDAAHTNDDIPIVREM